MTPDYHVVLGIVTIALAVLGYGLYIASVFKGVTKPHPFTWLLFAIVDGTVFFAQITNDAGPGAWGLGVATIINTLLFFIALRMGEKRIVTLDWICLIIAITGVAMWKLTDDAFIAVLFGCLVDAIAKIPTLRKSYIRPYEESISVWSIDLLKYSLSILALSTISWTTALFLAEIVLTNAVVVAVVLLRRRQLATIRS